MTSDYDEEEAPTHTRSDEKRVVDLVRLALAFEYSKKPLMQNQIKKSIFPYEHRTGGYVKRELLDRIMTLANERLERVFGFRLVPMPMVSRPRNTDTSEGRKKMMEAKMAEEKLDRIYCLVSLLPEEPRRQLSLHRAPEHLALLTTIICVLTLSSGDLSEPELFSILETLSVNSVFGNANQLEALMQSWARQRYLMSYRRRQASSDGEEVTMWAVGARAKVEMPLEVMLARFVGEMARVTEEPEAVQRHIAKAFELAQRRPAPVLHVEDDE